jgi:Protein of unknown function (DUF1194)
MLLRLTLALALLPLPAAAGCRLALALGLDVSASVDPAEYALQMTGMAGALLAPEVQAIILSDTANPVVLAVYVWSGPGDQMLVTDWTAVTDPETLQRIAAAIVAVPRRISFDGRTAIGSAMHYGAFLQDLAPRCDRQVIDLAADGMNNSGESPRGVRDGPALGRVTVNALAIGAAHALDLEVRTPAILEQYLLGQVIRGPGAFVEVAQDHRDFERAMTRKLIREIDVMMLGAR